MKWSYLPQRVHFETERAACVILLRVHSHATLSKKKTNTTHREVESGRQTERVRPAKRQSDTHSHAQK